MSISKHDIELVREISEEVKNFEDCYTNCILIGDIDGDIDATTILFWLLDNPYMAEIAANIKKIYQKRVK